jgi:hypothetical protein
VFAAKEAAAISRRVSQFQQTATATHLGMNRANYCVPWSTTEARRSVPGVDEFAIHRAAIDGFLKRAQSLRLEERLGLRVAIERQRKDGLAVSESVPNLREGARRLAELIIAQLRERNATLSPVKIRNSKRWSGSDSRTLERWFTVSQRAF